MAIPLLALAIGALAGGTALQASAARSRDKADAAALRRYANKNKARSAEAQAQFEKSLTEQNAEKQTEQIDQKADQKVSRVDNMIEALAPTFDPLLPGADRAPKVVQATNAKSLAEGLARARANLKATATLEGFSGRTFDRGLQLNRNQDLYRQQAIFDRGDRDVMEAERAAAQFKGGNKALLGDLLTMIGMIGLGGAGGAGSTVSAGAAKAGASGSKAISSVAQGLL
jgi:hypothetical protein